MSSGVLLKYSQHSIHLEEDNEILSVTNEISIKVYKVDFQLLLLIVSDPGSFLCINCLSHMHRLNQQMWWPSSFSFIRNHSYSVESKASKQKQDK